MSASPRTSCPCSSKSPATLPEKLRSKMSGTEKQQVTKQGTQNPEAYQLYVKGRYYWNKRTPADIKTAISYFNQAIDKDPGYALAYAGLADAYAVLANLWRTIPATSSPSRMPPPKRPWSWIPHSRARMPFWVSTRLDTIGIFPAARRSSEKPLSSIPAMPPPISGLPRMLAYIGGRAQESIDEANRAHELDPLSPIIGLAQGEAYHSDRQFDKAIEICKKVIADNPAFGMAHVWLAMRIGRA